jgi:hypothetical protein
MIKKIFSAMLCLLPFLGKAQVNISVQFPPGGLVQKNQLWNLILMNNREDITDLNIKMSLQNAVTGEVVLSAETRDIICSKGVKMITERDVQPVNYNYNNPDLSKAYLPLGSYIACYRIYHLGTKGEELLGDECVRLNIDPLSPPLLNTPADNTEIETPYPQFTWMPPTPIDMFTSLSYEIAVCEIKEGQKPVEAVQYNTPVYIKSGISQPAENYSTAYAKLEQGKSYAWQVVAVNGMNYTAKTEVWQFTVKKEKPEVVNTTNIYLQLKSVGESEGVYDLKENQLNIKYYSFDKEYNTVIRIKGNDGSILKETKAKVAYGDNFFNVQLPGNIATGKVYTVEIQNNTGTTHLALFRINK